MYGILYEWFLPATYTESELIDDFELLKKIAGQHGALSSHLFRSLDDNKFIGIQMWPSKQKYQEWFDQKAFAFKHNHPEEYDRLIKKIIEVYKNRFLDEIAPAV